MAKNEIDYYRRVNERNLSRTYIKITIKNSGGTIIIPYAYLEMQPPHMTVKRDWERWVRRVIKLAAQNGGWQLIEQQTPI